MLITVTREPVVESVHHVDAVVAGPSGPRLCWGDPFRPTVARSGLKLIQALPVVRTGAAERFGLSPEELSLSCASHNAEPGHIAAVEAWLAKIGLDPSALECGADVPHDGEVLAAHLAAGRGRERVANNCSGKHTGFLTVARHLGHDHAGYLSPDHPTMRLVTEAITEVCGIELDDQTPGRDGCGVPTWSIPLADLAGGMARLGRPETLDAGWRTAAETITTAVGPRPWWISGTGRHEVEVAAVATEPVILKGGAEGVFMGAVPAQGLGIAVKVADGAARAAQVAMSAVLAHLGAIPPEAVGRPVHNVAGRVVGRIDVELTAPDVLG